MERKKGFSVLMGAVLILSLGTAAFFSVRAYNRQRPMNRVVNLETFNWSFDSLIAREGELDNADGFWILSDPAAEGLNEAALRTQLELCIRTGADAVVVAKGNRIVCEWYSPRYEAPWGAMSSTKSVTALVVGIMEDKGLLRVGDSVGTYLPEWKDTDRSTITVEHLLTMTAGLPKYDSDRSVGFVANKNAYVLSLKPEKAPGKQWVYSNESYQLLVPVLEAASGVALDRFAQEYLFSLIGMEHSSYYSYNGEVWGYADMRTTPRDFLRLGLLVLNGGTWNENRILSQDYITRMLTPLPQFENYGYGWWLYDKSSPLAGYGTEGYLDTDMYVFPQEELLVMRMQAPNNTYTGKAESGSYQNLAWQLFPLICNEGDSDVILEVLRGFTDANVSPVFTEALDKATQLSSQGEVQAVIALLEPFMEKNTGSQAQLNQAFLTMTLAYMRKQDLKTAKKYFDKVDPEYLYLLPDWYSSSYREYAELLK